MPTARIRVTVNLEPDYNALIGRVAREYDIGISAYVRALVIHDLYKRGLVPHDMLLHNTTGVSRRHDPETVAAAS